jgi:hypothetical protein
VTPGTIEKSGYCAAYGAEFTQQDTKGSSLKERDEKHKGNADKYHCKSETPVCRWNREDGHTEDGLYDVSKDILITLSQRKLENAPLQKSGAEISC